MTKLKSLSRYGLWAVCASVVILPVWFAAQSPYLAYRQPVYIVAGFAGIVAMAVMVLQPVLMNRHRPVLNERTARQMHRRVGAFVVALVLAHVGGLWITSPPDVIDALTFTSATPFSVWGVLAMWGIFITAGLAVLRLTGRVRWLVWQRVHLALMILAALGTILHVLLIEGTMDPISKILLSSFLGGAVGWTAWQRLRRPTVP